MIACNENRNSVNNSVLLNWAGLERKKAFLCLIKYASEDGYLAY